MYFVLKSAINIFDFFFHLIFFSKKHHMFEITAYDW